MLIGTVGLRKRYGQNGGIYEGIRNESEETGGE